MAEAILAAARARAGLVGVAATRSLALGAGAALGEKAFHYLMSNKNIYDQLKQLNEWAPAVAGAAISMLYDLFKNRLGLPAQAAEIVQGLVDGVAAGLLALSFRTLLGLPFAFIKDGVLYVKNINVAGDGSYHVFIDGNHCTADTGGNLSCTNTIAEGVHDVAVAGDKAFYLRQYTVALGGTAQTA